MQSLLGGTSRAGARGRRRARAVAPIVGLVLMLGIVVTGASVVYVAGMDAKASVQDASRADSAETSLQAAGATFSSLAHDGGDATGAVEFGAPADDVEVDADGVLRVRLNDRAACTAETDLGTVVSKGDSGVEVAYQAGAVFRQSASGTTIVQSPPLDYRTESMNGQSIRTVSFPVTNVTGHVQGGGSVVATANASADGFQDDLCLTDDGAADLEYVREITITIEGSDYYEAWHRYFRQEFGAVATYAVDDATQTASVTAPLGAGVRPNQFAVDRFEVYAGIFATASNGELLLQTQHASIDSYDASTGPWGGSEPAYGDGGDVFTHGNVSVLANGATVSGNVYVAGAADLSESCGSGGEYCVDGDVYVNNSTPTGPGTALEPTEGDERAERISGAWGNGTGLPSIPAMDGTIDDTVAAASTWNTNDETPTVSGEQIQYAGGSATLDSGVYYLTDLTVPSGQTLELDTSDGDVVLVLEGDVTLADGATVTVRGDGRVNAYVGEAASAGDQLSVGEGVTVRAVEGGDRTYRSNAFVLACKADCSASFADTTPSDPTTFTGVLYGPGDESADGTVSLGKHVDVWGALVAGTVTFEQQSEFHFDESLRNRVGDADGDGVPDPDTGGGLTYVDPPVENGYVVTVRKHDVNVTRNAPKALQPAAGVSRAGTHAVDASRAVSRATHDVVATAEPATELSLAVAVEG